jgi:hypothetical protein
MTALFLVILGLFLLAGLALAAGAFVRTRSYRGTMLITCPETASPEAVAVDWRHAAATGLVGAPDLRLRECTRWPERQDCGQACLLQIELTPETCQVRALLRRWYAGKACAFCHRAFGDIHWHDHRPGLRDPQGRTLEWNEVPARELIEVLSTHQPVCWNCHIAESFRREHPDLVVERPPQPPPAY